MELLVDIYDAIICWLYVGVVKRSQVRHEEEFERFISSMEKYVEQGDYK